MQLTRPFKPDPNLPSEYKLEHKEGNIEIILEYRPGEKHKIRFQSNRITLYDKENDDFWGAVNVKGGLPRGISRNAILNTELETLLDNLVEEKKAEILMGLGGDSIDEHLTLFEKTSELERYSRVLEKNPHRLPISHIANEYYENQRLTSLEKKRMQKWKRYLLPAAQIGSVLV
jgi:hypothetical protein